jgi:alkanesulfonate monooxygenase SsuD/methylene tetrahydromethanopterin reductase-like flavin-dependent oxidoreductase (luciferase family)
MARLRESVRICKALLSGSEPVSYAGEHYRIENLEPIPQTVQRPRPPVMLGGRQRRMLSLAAQEADIVGISLLGQDAGFEQKIAWVRNAAGARLPRLDLHVNVSRLEVGNAAAGEDAPGALIGSVSQIAETLHARRERYGLNYYIIKGQAMDAFAPVLTRVR